jgi:hypothetical protein
VCLCRLLLSAPVPVTTILWPHFVMYGMRKCTLMRRSLSEGIWLTAPYVGPDISAMKPPAGPILQGVSSKATLRFHTGCCSCLHKAAAAEEAHTDAACFSERSDHHVMRATALCGSA